MDPLKPFGQTVYRGCVISFETSGEGPSLSVRAEIVLAGALICTISRTESKVPLPTLIENCRAAAFEFVDRELANPVVGMDLPLLQGGPELAA